jgi:hypothetical protein
VDNDGSVFLDTDIEPHSLPNAVESGAREAYLAAVRASWRPQVLPAGQPPADVWVRAPRLLPLTFLPPQFEPELEGP